MHSYHLSLNSHNSKTGNMPVSITSADTCPDSCSFKNAGCFAKYGPLLWHWQRVSGTRAGGAMPIVMNGSGFFNKIKQLPDGVVWRHNQAGDLPGKNNRLNIQALRSLVRANKNKRGFTYTHKPLFRKTEKQAIKEANENGFTINLSADSLEQADRLKNLAIGPVVVVVPSDRPVPKTTPAGNPIFQCPATKTGATITCKECKVCSVAIRRSVVAFPAHGSGKSYINKKGE